MRRMVQRRAAEHSERKAPKEKREQNVDTFIEDAEKRAGCSNTWTKNKPWRRGMQVIEEMTKDACPTQRAEEQKHEGWKEQRQVGSEVQESNPRPWEVAEYKLSKE